MLFIKGGELIGGLLAVINLDIIPAQLLSTLKTKLLDVVKNPAALIQR